MNKDLRDDASNPDLESIRKGFQDYAEGKFKPVFPELQVQPDERAAFEEWVSTRTSLPCTCDLHGVYVNTAVYDWWKVWQARATQQATKGEPEPSAAELEVAVETLRHVIDCLRKTGSYTDEEGEATNFLEPLLQVRATTPSTVAGSAGQANSVRQEVLAMSQALKDFESTYQPETKADYFAGGYSAGVEATRSAPTAPSLTTDAGAVVLKAPEGEDPMKHGDRSLETSIKRLTDAYCVQQAAPIPDQMALVWRFDIGRLRNDWLRLNAWQESVKGAEQRMSDAAPTFEGKHVALKQHGAKLTLTIELDAIDGAPRYRVTPINPAVARKAEIERSGGDA